MKLSDYVGQDVEFNVVGDEWVDARGIKYSRTEKRETLTLHWIDKESYFRARPRKTCIRNTNRIRTKGNG